MDHARAADPAASRRNHRRRRVHPARAGSRALTARRSKSPAKRDPARVSAIRAALREAIPDPRCELDHRNVFELLIATILSAQTTDKGVNRVTPALFERYPDAAAMAAAELSDLEAIVRPTGFFKVKAKHLRETARLLVEHHGGAVPRAVEELVALPGVARKTANVVLGTGFGIASGITVDTHARRVAQRLELTKHDDPVRIEEDLCAVIPRDEWIAFSHRLVLHGRYTCTARAPQCGACACARVCTFPALQTPAKLRRKR